MEQVYYDLSEHEFTKGRKILLWIFCISFFLVGISIVFMHVIGHKMAIHVSYSTAPFGISIFTGIIAYLSTVKRKDHYFLIDDEKIEYRYGLINPVKRTHRWNEIREIHIPHRGNKIMILYNENKKPYINLTWLERKKSFLIKRHIYSFAKYKNIKIVAVPNI